ncbi:HGxxPAAW family protein [Pedococcus sp. KACC 23699]|uniref:HGxxPAAW family protein n=1 Tax=Pedococcus sp. KACC 23699 TaxID=3149228 RepID=A0AAU7JTJ9_9MICO
MAEHEIHEDHGHSVAAWTAVVILLVGSAVMALAVALATVPLFVIGAVICVAGVVAGKVLGMAGYGAKDVPPVTSDGQKTSGVS